MRATTSKITDSFICTPLCQRKGNVGYLWSCPRKSGHMCHCTWGAEQDGGGGGQLGLEAGSGQALGFATVSLTP